jgi:hypothetical protein
VPFYKELGNQGVKATDIPVIALSVGEEELAGVDTKPLVGHLAAWSYFESVDTLENKAFIAKWRDDAAEPPYGEARHDWRSAGRRAVQHCLPEPGAAPEARMSRQTRGASRTGPGPGTAAAARRTNTRPAKRGKNSSKTPLTLVGGVAVLREVLLPSGVHVTNPGLHRAAGKFIISASWALASVPAEREVAFLFSRVPSTTTGAARRRKAQPGLDRSRELLVENKEAHEGEKKIGAAPLCPFPSEPVRDAPSEYHGLRSPTQSG